MRARKDSRCPAHETLVRVFQGELSLQRRTKVYRHIIECPDCARKLELLQSLHADLKDAVDNLCHSLETRVHVEALLRATRIRQRKDDERRDSVKPSLFSPKAFRKFALVAAVLICVSASFVLWRILAPGPVYRGAESSTLTLLSPLGNIKDPPSCFEWTPVRNSDFYFLFLTDENLKVLLDVHPAKPRFPITADKKNLFQDGMSYSWTVTAYDDDHNLLDKKSASFTYRPFPSKR